MQKCKSVRIEPEINLDLIKQFVDQKVKPGSQARDEKGEFDHALVRELHELGVLKFMTPKEYGGLELPVADLIWVARALASGSAGIAATFIGNILGYSAVVLYGQKELRDKICNQFQNRFSLWSFGMTEKACGSDLEKTATTAVRTRDGYIINGEKNFITNGSYSTDICLFAQTLDENGHKLGISCFYVPGDSEGLTRGAGEKKMGWRESNTGHLFLKDVRVPHGHLLAHEGDGLKILSHCLNRSKTLLGAVSVGICDRALELTLERLSTTVRYDRALLDKHSIRHILARLSLKVDCSWMLTCRAAAAWDHNDSATKEASMAKLFGGETATEVTGECLELFGARGFLAEYEISRLYRDSKAIEIVEGPTLIQELLISKFVLEMVPKDQKNIINFQNKIKKAV